MDKIRLIAELGLNHQGKIDIALQLIDMAHRCGADAVKLQRRTPEVSTPKAMWNAPRTWGGVDMSYIEYRRLVEFGTREYDAIDLYCRRLGMEWSVSVWDQPALEWMKKYSLPWIKIPSALLTNLDLLKHAVAYSPVIASTGMSTKQEVADAVRLIEHDRESMLMHCHSAYPAPDAELSLPVIGKLREWFDMQVGYSSHSSTPYPAIFAGVLGAVAVEAHITLDRTMEGSDHAASLEEKGLALLRRELNRIPLTMANSEKKVWDSELPARKKLRGV